MDNLLLRGDTNKEILDLEANLIGSITLDHKRFLQSQEDGLLPEHFENTSYRRAYEIMLEHQASDVVTIMHNMNNKNMFNDIREASAYCISSAGFPHWMKQMNLKTSKNKLRNLAKKIPNIVNENITIEEMIDKVNDLLINNKITKTSGSPKNVIDVINTVEQELKDANSVSKNLLKTGFKNIDQKIKGFKPGDLIVVAGRPGMGKTTWALNIATNNVMQGKKVLIFSLEMTNEQLVKKIISSEAGIPMDSLIAGNMTKQEWSAFDTIKQKLSDSGLYIYDKSPITIETLINKTKAIQSITDVDLIVVDYLQLLMTTNKAPSNSDNRTASMTYISNLLKGLAKEISCPLISLSQLNRGVEARTDKRPVLSDLRDSGSIEQDADMVIMLYRQEYYDSLDTGLAEVIIRKNRLGETGEFELGFEGHRSRFVDPEEQAFGGKKEYGQI